MECEVGVWSVECGVWSVECGVRSGVMSVKCEVWSLETGVECSVHTVHETTEHQITSLDLYCSTLSKGYFSWITRRCILIPTSLLFSIFGGLGGNRDQMCTTYGQPMADLWATFLGNLVG